MFVYCKLYCFGFIDPENLLIIWLSNLSIFFLAYPINVIPETRHAY